MCQYCNIRKAAKLVPVNGVNKLGSRVKRWMCEPCMKVRKKK